MFPTLKLIVLTAMPPNDRDAIHLNSAGLSITAIFPSAFVSLSTSNSLRSSRTDPLARITCQLRVATSGAWHNLLFWILISSVMWSEIFSDGAFWAGSGYGLWKNVKSYGPVVVSVMDVSYPSTLTTDLLRSCRILRLGITYLQDLSSLASMIYIYRNPQLTHLPGMNIYPGRCHRKKWMAGAFLVHGLKVCIRSRCNLN